MKTIPLIAIAALLTSCGGGIATRSAGNINIQAKAGNDVIIRLAGNDATQAAEKTQSIAAQAEATVDRTAVGGNDAKVDATAEPAKYPAPNPTPEPPVTDAPAPPPEPPAGEPAK